jgi:hypothetical protein
MYSTKVNCKKGDNRITVMATKLMKGAYLAKVSSNTISPLVARFVVQ